MRSSLLLWLYALNVQKPNQKDFGIIATDKGWNLYIRGNGGMRPRHGDLCYRPWWNHSSAIHRPHSDVLHTYRGSPTAYIGMMENLEGGIEYLKQVVIEDKTQRCWRTWGRYRLVIENTSVNGKPPSKTLKRWNASSTTSTAKKWTLACHSSKNESNAFQSQVWALLVDSQRDEKLANADQIEVTEVS